MTDRPRTSDVRKAIPLSVQIIVYQRTVRELMGLAPDTPLHVDHNPALGIRHWDPATSDFDPPQHHPDFLFIKSDRAHREKTSGKGHTSYGSDVHAIAKIDRIVARSDAGEKFASQVLGIGFGEGRRRQKQTIPSRPFQKRPKKRERQGS